MSAEIRPDTVVAIDLTKFTEDQRSALRQQAMLRGLSLAELLAELVLEVARRQFSRLA